jgi:paraquat-inducible protein B
MMGRRVNPVKVGAFVIGGLVILVGAIMIIGSGRIFRRTHPFVSYFDGSVNGLRAGASVKFKGVEVGKVDSIRIPGGLTPTDQPIAVIFSLDGNKLEASGNRAGAMPKFLKGAIENGLRAQLETDSLVTGVLFVSLSFAPETPARVHDLLDGVMEIPTIPPPLQEIGAGIRSIVDRIDRYPFERVFDSLQKALDAFTEFSRSPEIHSAFSSLDSTLKELDLVMNEFRPHVEPLGARLRTLLERGDALGSDLQLGVSDGRATLTAVQTLSDRLSEVLPPLVKNLEATSSRLESMAVTLQTMVESARVVLDPQAPLAVELRAGFREIGEAARALRALLELLEHNPGALVRGTSPAAGGSK